jgi:hypothetical protein
VIKSLASFALLVVVLAASAQACGVPAANNEPTQTLVEAQATNVRRTAVAEVQRIIANIPAATSTPAATAMARPTCQDAIWWHEARAQIGQSRKVQGPVVATRPAPDGLVLVEIGQRYPDPTGFGIFVPAGAVPTLDGKTVCVTGRITNTEGQPTIVLRDAASMVVVN